MNFRLNAGGPAGKMGGEHMMTGKRPKERENAGMKLGWVDFSREARKRAVEALDALEEKDAVDELGVGVLRDAFADAMFPGTSTIQTRAKYFGAGGWITGWGMQ